MKTLSDGSSEYRFNTISSEDWKRSLRASKETINEISEQIGIMMKEKYHTQFAAMFNDIANDCHNTARDHGFHDEPVDDGRMIALMHGELSEALDALRHGNPPDDHIPEFSGVEAELADTIIRICDFAGLHKLAIGEAIEAKREYNRTRPRLHGKKF